MNFRAVKVLADGFAIFWESIAVVLSLPDLLMVVLGSKTLMAKVYSEIEHKGGRFQTELVARLA